MEDTPSGTGCESRESALRPEMKAQMWPGGEGWIGGMSLLGWGQGSEVPQWVDTADIPGVGT